MKTMIHVPTIIIFFLFKHKLFVKTFAQEQKCSSKELMQSQYMYIYLPKSTNVVQVQCMGSDMR